MNVGGSSMILEILGNRGGSGSVTKTVSEDSFAGVGSMTTTGIGAGAGITPSRAFRDSSCTGDGPGDVSGTGGNG